jgi:hypothetical protein
MEVKVSGNFKAIIPLKNVPLVERFSRKNTSEKKRPG